MGVEGLSLFFLVFFFFVLLFFCFWKVVELSVKKN